MIESVVISFFILKKSIYIIISCIFAEKFQKIKKCWFSLQ
ncbi:hypothetical protein CCAN2_2030003 [Capnocytophaga canimorsus]|nr:hypothetical protein CCAN2_2030003 [Capnocytophaga canimorsus]